MPMCLTPMSTMISCRIDTDAPPTWAPRYLRRPTALTLAAQQTSGALVWFYTRCWSAGIRSTTPMPSPCSAWSEMVDMLFRNVPSLSKGSVLFDGCCAAIHRGGRRPRRYCATLGSTSAVGHHHALTAIISKKRIAEVALAKTSTLYPVLDITLPVTRLFRKEQTSEAAWMISVLISSYL